MLSLACSAVACTTVRRMLLAWKNAQRLEASTFLLMASVCAPLPSVSDSARNKAITAISNAIFLFEPEACSACSACSMLSCAPMIPLLPNDGVTIAEPYGKCKRLAVGVHGVTAVCQRRGRNQPRGCAVL